MNASKISINNFFNVFYDKKYLFFSLFAGILDIFVLLFFLARGNYAAEIAVNFVVISAVTALLTPVFYKENIRVLGPLIFFSLIYSLFTVIGGGLAIMQHYQEFTVFWLLALPIVFFMLFIFLVILLGLPTYAFLFLFRILGKLKLVR